MSEDKECNCENCEHETLQQPKTLNQQLVEKLREVLEIKKVLETTAILFIASNPIPMFVRQYNAERQAMMEIAFDYKNVPDPMKAKDAIAQYVR